MNSLKNIICFDRRKAVVGAIFGIIVLILCCVRYKWYTGVAFSLTFLTAGCIKLNIKSKKIRFLIAFLGAMAVALIAWYASIALVNTLNGMKISPDRVILNILCIFILYGFVFLITSRWKMSVIITASILLALSTANGIIYQLRGKEIGPMDFFSVKTALGVKTGYSLDSIKFTKSMVYGWIKWAMVIFMLFSLPELPKFSKKKARCVVLIGEVIAITVLWVASAGIPIRTWNKQGTQINGYFLNFLLGVRDSIIKAPTDYEPEAVGVFAQKYIQPENPADENKMPNIIAIMDESFVDFGVLGDVRTNQPVTPFIDSLSENTIKGYALSSVYGGNTANSEFEFLTGHSLAFLPENAVPYQQYIEGEIYTLAWQMRNYGYKNFATHPYHEAGWSRNKNYPLMGFPESTFLESYSEKTKIRKYISDQGMFEYVLQKLQEKTPGEEMFLFGITMQNHGAYDYDGEDFVKTIELEGYTGEYPLTEQYLSVIHETDSAVKYLLNALEDYPEDTLVLFFGDHYPKVETEFYEEVYGKTFDTLSEQIKQYTVPFFIWANYDIKEETDIFTSLNFLSVRLLETAGLKLSPYHGFLDEVQQVIPAMNAMGYYSLSKGGFIPYKEAEGAEKDMLDRYSMLQYNNLFDAENRNQEFFGQFIVKEEPVSVPAE